MGGELRMLGKKSGGEAAAIEKVHQQRTVGVRLDLARSGGLLRVLRPHAVDTRGNPLHLVFAVQFHLLELDFFEEVFRTEVGGPGDSLQLDIVLLVLLGQTLVFGVCLENYVPRCPRDACHAFLLMTGFVNGVLHHISER
jgi:hypothetical protein